MRKQWIFPSILIILDICAAIAYLPGAKYHKFGYWIAAAVLTAMVTYFD